MAAMTLQDVRITDRFSGALATPDAAAPAPGLLVVHDITGLGEDTRRILARFARSGYAALAPDLYEAAGRFCVTRTLLDLAIRRGAAFERLDAALGVLRARPEVDGARTGVVGFCMGGGFAVVLAARGGFQACAPYYGPVPRRQASLAGICPVVGGWGGRDLMFASQGRRLQRHLAALGVESDVVVYPQAGHAYMNQLDGLAARLGPFGPLRAAYDHETAEDSWTRMLTFFARHLGGPAPEPPAAQTERPGPG